MITGVSWWGHKVDNAYWIWNFQGKIIKKATVDKFCQLTWRPRPPTLLSKEQLKDVKKNLKNKIQLGRNMLPFRSSITLSYCVIVVIVDEVLDLNLNDPPPSSRISWGKISLCSYQFS